MYGPRLRSHVRPQTPVTYEWDHRRANTPTDRQDSALICLRNMTPLLALYCHPNDPVASTVLLPTQIMIVLICIRYIDQPIAPIRLLSRPYRPTDRRALRSTTITTRRSHRTATLIWQLLCLYACDLLTNWSCRYAYDLPLTNRSCPCACDPTTNW